MTKNEMIDKTLSELLHETSEMTADKAREGYRSFVKETETRIDGVIYRLKHHYNLGNKLNSINRQSKLTKKSFSAGRNNEGL